jgi:hypothetical protein
MEDIEPLAIKRTAIESVFSHGCDRLWLAAHRTERRRLSKTNRTSTGAGRADHSAIHSERGSWDSIYTFVALVLHQAGSTVPCDAKRTAEMPKDQTD